MLCRNTYFYIPQSMYWYLNSSIKSRIQYSAIKIPVFVFFHQIKLFMYPFIKILISVFLYRNTYLTLHQYTYFYVPPSKYSCLYSSTKTIYKNTYFRIVIIVLHRHYTDFCIPPSNYYFLHSINKFRKGFRFYHFKFG